MILKLLLINCFAILPFLFTLNGDFVFDDSEAVVKNNDVVSSSFWEPFYNDFWGTNITSNFSHKSYRPLTVLSFRLNYLLSGLTLVAFHFKIFNLISHVICCNLVYWTFEIILRSVQYHKIQNVDISFLSCLLFSVHPIHVEAVSGVVGRADVLSAIWFFISFLIYNKSLNQERYSFTFIISSVATAATSMLFKENGVTVLGLCFLYEIIRKVKVKKELKCGKHHLYYFNLETNSILRLITLGLSTAVLLLARWLVMGGVKPEFQAIDNPAAFSNNYYSKVGSYNYIYFLNFLILVWPQWLCFDWSMGCVPLLQSLLDYRVVCLIVFNLYGLLILRFILSKHQRRKTVRVTIIALALLIIPFLPASNIFFPVGFVVAERILYIPSAGFCLLIVLGVDKLVSRVNKKIVLSFFYSLVLIFSARTWQRSKDWQNEYSLFVSGLAVCPLNAKVHYNVAKVADASNNLEWAVTEYREAIRLYPEYYQAMNNLANILKSKQQYREAEEYLRKAIKLKKDFPAAWMNLGIVLANTKRYEESQEAYKTALFYRKKYPDCLYNLGNLFLETNKTSEAEKTWLQAIELNPKHTLAWTNLLALLDNTGQFKKAIQLIPAVLKELPESPSVNFVIANTYGKLNLSREAEQHFKKAILLFGDKVQALHFANLGVLYHRWKKHDLAEKMYRKALKLDPYFKSAQNNLKSLKKLKS